MRLYWSVRSIPELADLSELDRERLWRRGYRRSLRTRPTQIALASALGLAGAGLAAGRPWAIGLGALAGAGLLFQVAAARARPFLREERDRLLGDRAAAGEHREPPGPGST